MFLKGGNDEEVREREGRSMKRKSDTRGQAGKSFLP